jgi:hypothetical protein
VAIMEQNNFEKNVQRQLDEFKIPPSDAVWANVEKHVGKKGKDRKLIFIIFIVTVILLSGGFWLFNSTKNNTTQTHQVSQLKKDSKPTNNEDSSFGKSKLTPHHNLKNTGSQSISGKKTKRFKVGSQNKIATGNEKKQVQPSDDFTSESDKNDSKPTNNQDFHIALNSENKSFEIKPDPGGIDNPDQADNVTANVQNQITIHDFTNHLLEEKNNQQLMGKNNSLSKKSSKNQDKNPWNFGMTFSGGASLISSNILEKNYPVMDLSSGFPPGAILNGGSPSYYYSASPIKNAAAFMAGVMVEKNLSAKNKISLGISYKYYSVTNKVGNKIDSTLRSAQYLATNYLINIGNRSKAYRNNFHYLEVPVSIKIQINKNKKLPLFWNAGVNISQLISSNALQFKSNPGVYYNDNSIFNKTQFGLHTGLSLTLFSRKKMPFSFGPYFYYSATSLADKGLYDGKHFSFVGIQTEILFRKK